MTVVDDIQGFLNEGKVLSAARAAHDAKAKGDTGPSELLLRYLSEAAKCRAKVFNALPHDTFKCPHSH